jgi:hypothetical protein
LRRSGRYRPTPHIGSSTFRSVRSFVFGDNDGSRARAASQSPYQPRTAAEWPNGHNGALGLQMDGTAVLEQEGTTGMESALAQTVRALGWVLALVGACFVVSLGVVAALVMSLPM